MYSIAFHFLDAHISACDLRSMDAPAGELLGQEVDVVLLPPSPRAVAGVNGGGRCFPADGAIPQFLWVVKLRRLVDAQHMGVVSSHLVFQVFSRLLNLIPLLCEGTRFVLTM